jgi:hypothetical protein
MMFEAYSLKATIEKVGYPTTETGASVTAGREHESTTNEGRVGASATTTLRSEISNDYW